MANYSCIIRSNYFHVKDEDKFKELMERVYGSEDGVRLFEDKDADGKPVFGFGTFGGIAGLRNSKDDEDEDADESAYDEFIDQLQECVAVDDAVIILESGSEQLRYIVGSATIITSKGYEYLNITQIAKQRAAQMLGTPDWETKCEY